MKLYVISDNAETQVGMRLAGIEGVVAHTPDEVARELNRVGSDPQVGIILLTAPLAESCRATVDDWKRQHTLPLLVSIPDRHGNGNTTDSILRYVREAVGIQL